MGRKHIVKQGECISSIAFEYGLLRDDIWEHPDNSDIKEKRVYPFVLMEGDPIIIPDVDRRMISVGQNKGIYCRTGSSHELVIVPPTEPFEITIENDDGSPRANTKYVLFVNTLNGNYQESMDGKTTGGGEIKVRIPPNASEVEIWVGGEPNWERINVVLGTMDPVKETSGIQGRLNNLGYFCGEADGEMGDMMRSAIQSFQEHHGLKIMGDNDDKVDPKTLAKIEEEHGI